jgi:hypothetical protein
MRELYVYYRVRGTDAAAAEAEVVALQTELRAATPGLRARLLKRPDEQDGRQTWMEIYLMESSADADGVGALLQATIEARAADRLTHIDGSRHVEVFLACAS